MLNFKVEMMAMAIPTATHVPVLLLTWCITTLNIYLLTWCILHELTLLPLRFLFSLWKILTISKLSIVFHLQFHFICSTTYFQQLFHVLRYPNDLLKRAKIHSVLDWHHSNLRLGTGTLQPSCKKYISSYIDVFFYMNYILW